MDNAIALPLTVADIVDEYAEKIASLPEAIAEFEAAHNRLKRSSIVQGFYVENVVEDVRLHESSIKLNLRKSGWKAVYSRLQIDRLATAKDKRLFEQTMADPPELTLDNAKATFGDYLLRPRFHVLRALAETFVQLDPAYKSHSKVKIGVSGLPKRIILTSVAGWNSWGYDRLRDMFRVLAEVRGEPIFEEKEVRPIADLHGHKSNGHGGWGFRNDAGTFTIRGTEVRVFQNGNAHVIFDKDTLRAINLALAEFYGDVLPDAEEEDAKPRPSTEVAKDLQYYPTPQTVIQTVLDEIGLVKHERRSWETSAPQPKRVLEPSCGDGRFMDEIRTRGHDVTGVEVHYGRAGEALAKGHKVITYNFLDLVPNPDKLFDCVVMNPPFYGRHYRKHLEHARKFVRPGGVLACILPASAWYDHGGLDGEWHDLPVASFAESGTNIPTGFVVMHAART